MAKRRLGSINSAVKTTNPAYPTCAIAAAGPCYPGATNFINAVNDSELYAFHVGGCFTCFADGSVHFISENISLSTLGALFTRSAGDIPGEY
jgi:hypothetical protein